MKVKLLSVIMPVYNEKDTILEVLEKIKNSDIGDIKKEIIIVDDFSTDGTREQINNLKNKDLKILFHEKNLGKGAAIRTAIRHSTGEIILIQDGDLEYEPNDYKRLITPIINKEADVVYGSRILKKGDKKYSGISFYMGGLFLTFLTNVLYPSARITDESTCYKVFKSDVIKNMRLRCKRFEFCPEVTAKVLKRGIKIHEVPISYYPRTLEEGKKIRWKDGFEAMWALLKYRFME